MMNAADKRQPAPRSFFDDLLPACFLWAVNFFVWRHLGVADSTAGALVGIVLAGWPVAFVVLERVHRRGRRPARMDKHLLRAARKVAAVATPPERSGGAR